jgi:hypothetical protein
VSVNYENLINVGQAVKEGGSAFLNSERDSRAREIFADELHSRQNIYHISNCAQSDYQNSLAFRHNTHSQGISEWRLPGTAKRRPHGVV